MPHSSEQELWFITGSQYLYGPEILEQVAQDAKAIAQLLDAETAPGIAAQRLMASGFGFASEGDWNTAALVRIKKVMASGLPGGMSFMEDYTYDLAGQKTAKF